MKKGWKVIICFVCSIILSISLASLCNTKVAAAEPEPPAIIFISTLTSIPGHTYSVQ